MQNIPDVHALDREIPAGKVLVAEYSQVDDDAPRPVETVLDEKLGWGRTPVKLVARTAGWAIAGSMLRWDNGRYGVYWEMDGARHGSSSSEARAPSQTRSFRNQPWAKALIVSDAFRGRTMTTRHCRIAVMALSALMCAPFAAFAQTRVPGAAVPVQAQPAPPSPPAAVPEAVPGPEPVQPAPAPQRPLTPEPVKPAPMLQVPLEPEPVQPPPTLPPPRPVEPGPPTTQQQTRAPDRNATVAGKPA